MIIERIKVIVDEFPKSCLFCSCASEGACYWDAYTGNVWHKITEKEYSKRPDWCPLEVETDEPNEEAKIIMQQQEKIAALQVRLSALEEQLRWRPVSVKPEKSDYYEVKYEGCRVPNTDIYDVKTGWMNDVKPDYWRPIPELKAEVKVVTNA